MKKQKTKQAVKNTKGESKKKLSRDAAVAKEIKEKGVLCIPPAVHCSGGSDPKPVKNSIELQAYLNDHNKDWFPAVLKNAGDGDDLPIMSNGSTVDSLATLKLVHKSNNSEKVIKRARIVGDEGTIEHSLAKTVAAANTNRYFAVSSSQIGYSITGIKGLLIGPKPVNLTELGAENSSELANLVANGRIVLLSRSEADRVSKGEELAKVVAESDANLATLTCEPVNEAFRNIRLGDLVDLAEAAKRIFESVTKRD